MAKKANTSKAPKANTAKPAAKDTGLGPNAQYPFGIKITDKAGNISWERFKTAADRDKRHSSLPGSKRTDFILDQPAAAAKPEPPLGNPQGITLVGAAKGAVKPPAAKPAAAEAPKPAAAKKPAKPEAAADSFPLHLNNTGRLCFSAAAAKRLAAAVPGGEWKEKHMAIAIDGKTIRLDLAKPAADTLRIGDGGGRPYISATKAFKSLGWNSEALDIPAAKPYGKGGFEFRIA